jgi:hypothetical protein
MEVRVVKVLVSLEKSSLWGSLLVEVQTELGIRYNGAKIYVRIAE